MPQADIARVIIHAGFHKTGTTTVQRALDTYRALIEPYARILLKPDIAEVCDAALLYARAPSPTALTAFSTAMRAHLTAWDPADQRAVIISAEDLCGLIPGRRGRQGYPHASALLQQLITDLAAFFPSAQPQLYFSTREGEAWMRSCHAHHLRHARCTLDEFDYATEQRADADLTAIVAGIAAHVDPVPVTAAALEDSTTLPHGPLTPLLDLLDLPRMLRNQIAPLTPANTALPRDISTAFLALNRSDLDEPALATAKRALIANHKKATR
jgi:hypothetical protein